MAAGSRVKVPWGCAVEGFVSGFFVTGLAKTENILFVNFTFFAIKFIIFYYSSVGTYSTCGNRQNYYLKSKRSI